MNVFILVACNIMFCAGERKGHHSVVLCEGKQQQSLRICWVSCIIQEIFGSKVYCGLNPRASFMCAVRCMNRPYSGYIFGE